jgi:hypothetical protein
MFPMTNVKRCIQLATTLALFLACVFIAADQALAEDVIIDATVQSSVTKPDKNGSMYTRIIVPENRELQGKKYTVSVPVMFFGELANEAQSINPGDNIKVIAQSRVYKGNISYTALAFIK